MTGSFWWDLLIGVTAALLFAWLALVAVLLVARPRGGLLQEALRLLPDVLRLARRLAADSTLPRGVRVRLGFLLAYLAFPIDLIPDFIPVLGFADDAIIVTKSRGRVGASAACEVGIGGAHRSLWAWRRRPLVRRRVLSLRRGRHNVSRPAPGGAAFGSSPPSVSLGSRWLVWMGGVG